MKRLNALQSDQLTARLCNEFYEIDNKRDNLFEKDRIRYWNECRRYVEKGRINEVYEFSINGKETKKGKNEKEKR